MRRATCEAVSANFRMRRASGRKLRPDGVSRTERLVRSRSGASMMCSSTWICRDSGGWVMLSRAAARPKCSSSATVTKQRSWFRSNIDTGPEWTRRLFAISSIDLSRNKDGGRAHDPQKLSRGFPKRTCARQREPRRVNRALAAAVIPSLMQHASRRLQLHSLNLADNKEISDRRQQGIEPDEDQRTVEGTRCRQDV